ncbi:MAG: DMT family transporter [Parachlamydiales bacterium]
MKLRSPFTTFILLILIWGMNFPISKIGLEHISATHFILLRFIFATITMFLIVIGSNNFVIPRKKDLPVVLVVSLFQIALTLFLSNYGLSILGAGKASFLIYTTSVWVIPLSLFWGSKLAGLDWTSFLLGIIGVLLFVNPLYLNWHERIWIGDAAMLGGSLCWAIGIMFARHMKWHRPPLQLLPWQLLFASFCTFVWAYLEGEHFALPDLNFPTLGSVFYAGSIATAVGYWLMIHVSIKLRPSVTSLGLIFVPIISLFLSYLFLDEHVDLKTLSASGLIIAGIILHIYSERRKARQEQCFKEVP